MSGDVEQVATRWALAALKAEWKAVPAETSAREVYSYFKKSAQNPPAEGLPLTPYNRATFYGGEAAGYTDYPVYGELERA